MFWASGASCSAPPGGCSARAVSVFPGQVPRHIRFRIEYLSSYAVDMDSVLEHARECVKLKVRSTVQMAGVCTSSCIFWTL